MEIQKEFNKLASSERAKINQRFFKTGPGEYGEGDIFIGVRMPDIRLFAKENSHIDLNKAKKLIRSTYHEERMLGLIILCNKYKIAKTYKTREKLFQIYIKHFKYINNWDLVDVTCPHLIGKHLIDSDRSLLYVWAKSDDLWTKRIAIVTNWWFIRKGDLKDIFEISKTLLEDEHDLIHKAVGWMLREAGKKDIKKEGIKTSF